MLIEGDFKQSVGGRVLSLGGRRKVDFIHMEITPCSFTNRRHAKVTYGKSRLPSIPFYDALIVAFEGHAGNSRKYHGTYAYMEAMTAAGVAVWRPKGVVLDLRKLAYEWGDE